MHARPASMQSENVARLDLPAHCVFGRCIFRLENMEIMVTILSTAWVKSVCILKTLLKRTSASKLVLVREAVAPALSTMERQQSLATVHPTAVKDKIPRN